MSDALSPLDRPIVFVNFWREGGMRHYSESLVHALLPGARVCYLRNYATLTAADGHQLDLDFRPFRPANWVTLIRVAGLLHRLQPRAVHLNNEQPALLFLYPLLAFHNSVITLHDARSHAGESVAKRLFHTLHLRLVRWFIRKVIVHSEAIRDALPAWFPRERVSVMPHVNYGFWTRGPVMKLPASPLTVLFFGRILAYKGLEILVAAFRLLDPARFRLVIAGLGTVPDCRGLNVEIFPGFVADSDMGSHFRHAHVVALPYHAASQSGVAYLALAFGKPIVASRVGALPDVIQDGENGLLIPPNDPAALAAALERLADPAMRARLEENIRRSDVSSDAEIRARLLAIYDA